MRCSPFIKNKELLQGIDIEALAESLKEELAQATGQKKTRVIKRLEVVEAFRKSGNHLDWMILVMAASISIIVPYG